MKVPDHIEINKIAVEFLRLKKLSDNNSKEKARFDKYKNYCAKKMEHLIDFRVNKYKKFSNYNDLKQDGFEALMLAFKTYDPKKGDFTWWANKYISTRVSRSANTHSTIRYPLKKTKTMQPYKVSKLPQMVSDENPLQQVENSFELELVMRAINSLPELQRQVIVMHHEFDGGKNSSLAKIAKALCISRGVCLDLLTQAQNKIKEQLSPYYE